MGQHVKYKVGDIVAWESSCKRKEGKIVSVVEPGEIPGNYTPKGFLGRFKILEESYSPAKLGGGRGRNHVSYLVAVGRYVYWPKVSLLELVRR